MTTIFGTETVKIGGNDFVANVIPDAFDERDLPYVPRLALLPAWIDSRDDANKAEYVYTQAGQSCTGHTIAAVVNIIRIIAKRRELQAKGILSDALLAMPRVSPYMLYYFARRYDEFSGEDDIGSSLRGVLKGWFHESVCYEDQWLDATGVPRASEASYTDQLRANPLGAYFRVNPKRLDDMQAAISELGAIAASAQIHAGWTRLKGEKDANGKDVFIIRQGTQPVRMGHAFALVGYNPDGFLVQNSWGKEWGKKGFATLPYEDWLANAYDAWVVRPGVPSTPFGAELLRKTGAVVGETGAKAFGAGWDPVLTNHVVNVGNNGLLSRDGFVSTPAQLDGIISAMGADHRNWRENEGATRQDVVLYAHGGLVSEESGLSIAGNMRDQVWRANKIFPVTFSWESGWNEVLKDQISDWWTKRPFGAGLEDIFDRAFEQFVKRCLRGFWDEMKENARAASAPMATERPDDLQPGATLFAKKLAAYVASEQVMGRTVNVHLAGHSAGSIMLSALLDRLDELGVPVKSASFLAPAIRTDDFANAYKDRLGHSVEKLALFAMTDQREKDDVCAAGSVTAYHKSLLYLVSRAFERSIGSGSVPILGMETFLDEKVGVERVDQFITNRNGIVVLAGRSKAKNPAGYHSDSKSHGGFDEDSATRAAMVKFVLSS